jgi:hypothetical protein
MAKLNTPADTANLLTARERVLLFCAASGTDWAHAGITGENVTAMIVKGLIERNAAGQLTPTDRGHAMLRALLSDLWRLPADAPAGRRLDLIKYGPDG